MTSTIMLQINHVRKTFGSLVAVDDVSFALERGQLVGLLGPNGAGKTTTVSMIAGLVTPARGEVLIGGHRLTGDTDPAKRRIGLVPQDLALYDELSARANLRFFGALYHLAGRGLDEAIARALDLVGLTDRIVVIDHGRVIADDTLAGLQSRFAPVGGGRATLESMFLTLTGRTLRD